MSFNKPIIVTRHRNRKLYDSTSNSYTNLDEIEELQRRGYTVQVIDDKTKKDITYLTYLNIKVKNEKARLFND